MKTPFGKNAVHFMLAGTIALTPIAANLMMVTNSAHAAVTTQSTSLQDEIYQNLTASDKDAINAANSKITNDQIASILGNDLIKKIDDKTSVGTAVKLASDLAKLQYQSSSNAYDQAVADFKTNHSADFDKIFDGHFSVDQAISLFPAFQTNLKSGLFASFLSTTATNFNDIVATAINNSIKNAFPQLDTLLTTKLGISVKNVLDMRTNIENAVDPSLSASAALFQGPVRINGGDISGDSSVTLGSSSSYSFIVSKILPITKNITWKTDNSAIAYFMGNKLVTKTAGKVKIYVYYLDRPILTKDISIIAPPAVPTVSSVGYNDKVITGNAEKYTFITVKKGITTVATGKTNSSGIFSVTMKTAQKVGTVLSVTAAKDAANKYVSKAKTVTVVDKYAPAVPTVYSVGYKDKLIKGKAEKGSKISVKKGKTEVAKGYTNSSGNFSVSMKTTQKTGTVLSVTATDASKNVSKAKTVTVVDKYAPAKPVVYTVHSKNKVINGKAEAGSTITIKKGSKVLAYAKVSSKGKFSVRISTQKSGTVLYVTSKDKAKNVSQSTKVIVKR